MKRTAYIFLLTLMAALEVYSSAALGKQPVIFRPFEGWQTEYLRHMDDEVLFAGDPGNGKTDALIIDALGLQYANMPLGHAAIEEPEYTAIIFRRNANQVGVLIDKATKYYAPLGATITLNRQGDPGATARFPSRAKIILAHL
jgi:hypothetical protein